MVSPLGGQRGLSRSLLDHVFHKICFTYALSFVPQNISNFLPCILSNNSNLCSDMCPKFFFSKLCSVICPTKNFQRIICHVSYQTFPIYNLICVLQNISNLYSVISAICLTKDCQHGVSIVSYQIYLFCPYS